MMRPSWSREMRWPMRKARGRSKVTRITVALRRDDARASASSTLRAAIGSSTPRGDRVERRGRLVADQDFRFGRHGPGESDAPLRARRKLGRELRMSGFRDAELAKFRARPLPEALLVRRFIRAATARERWVGLVRIAR